MICSVKSGAGTWVAPFVLVAAPTWARHVDGPEDLDGIPLVAYAQEAPILRRYWRTVSGTRLTRAPEVVVADLRGVLAAIVAGAGASGLPTYLCGPSIAAGRLQLLAQPSVPPVNTLFLAHRAAALGQPGTAMVHAHLLRHFATTRG